MQFDHLSTPFLLNFYGWWQFSVCLFAFVALLAIWWHIGKKRADFGQVWLALSVLCWSLSGLLDIYFSNILMAEWPAGTDLSLINQQIGENYEARTFWVDGWHSVFSLLNSLFILLSLPWFKYVPDPIRPHVQSNYWNWIIGIPFLFAIIPTGVRIFTQQTFTIISELDAYYSILTLIFLGWVLWASFAKRRMKWLAVLSIVCITIVFVAQVYKLTGSEIDLRLCSAIFKSCLIMIFFALAMSWVKELAEPIIPDKSQLKLILHKIEGSNSQFELQGIPGVEAKRIALSNTNFALLHRFAHQKKNGQDPWLEIKPKGDSRSGKTYDINDYNEIKRLMIAMLDGLYGKNVWSKEHHFQPLKNGLFVNSENRDRRVQLSLSPEQIVL